MLRWISGVICFDHNRNNDIEQQYGIASVIDKMREACLPWYGHVLHAHSNTIARLGLQLEVNGKHPKGQPKQRCFDTLHGNLRTTYLHPDQAHN